MAQRGAGARFMAGAWVFPGGVVDEVDRTDQARHAVAGVLDPAEATWRAAALRETVEETGVWLSAPPRVVPSPRPHGAAVYAAALREYGRFAGSAMVWLTTWVTPTLVPLRFEARFYVAIAPPGIDGIADGVEMDAVAWVTPPQAMAAADSGSLLLPFPTRKTLELFARLGSAERIAAHATAQPVVPRIQPRLRLVGEDTIEAVLPDDPGYDELGDLPADPATLAGVVRVTSAKGEAIPELGRHAD